METTSKRTWTDVGRDIFEQFRLRGNAIDVGIYGLSNASLVRTDHGIFLTASWNYGVYFRFLSCLIHSSLDTVQYLSGHEDMLREYCGQIGVDTP